MTWLDDLPVQRKLGFAMLLTSTVVVVIACVVFLTVEYFGYRNSLIHTVTTLARITADNNTAAIAFYDQREARQNLEALRAEPQIIAAVLFDNQGKVFAEFTTPSDQALLSRASGQPGVRLENGYVIAVQPVVENGRRLGTLYLRASMNQIYERMRIYASGVLGVLALSLVLAWLIASMLRHILARPILELANTAEAVSVRQDYTLRARQYGHDELGRLTVAFNDMLLKTQSAIGALQESEWNYRQLVRALPTAAYMCDARGLITIYNDAAVKLWGRSPEIGLESWCGSYKIFRSDGTPLPLDHWPMAVSLREGRAVRGEEIIIERPDGTQRNVMPHPEPIHDTSGKLIGIVNMLVDITDQRRADAMVHRLAAIVESSDDAIISKDLDGIITTWNLGAEKLYGYSAAEIIGRPVALLIPDDRLNEEPNILERIRADERIEHYETVRCRRDGTRIEISLSVSPIKDAKGNITGASKIARDITERKRSERHAGFLGRLSQSLSLLDQSDEIICNASREVGSYLGANRCYFAEFDETNTIGTVKADWAEEGLSSLEGSYRTEDYGKLGLWQIMTSRSLVIPDVETFQPASEFRSNYQLLKIRALASTPYFSDGRGRSVLVVTSVQPRIWRDDEIDLLESAAARVWPLIEQARGQEALRQSERRQRNLMQTLPVACYTIDARGRLTFFNEAAVRLWGRFPALEQTIWSGAEAFTDPNGNHLLHEDSPVAIALKEKRPIRGKEVIILRPDGTRRWTVHQPDPLFDAEGSCIGVINVVMDVTEERTAHERVQKVAEHLNLAIASANLGDWNWDAETDEITLSPRTAEIYGVVAGPNLTRSEMRDLLHPDDRERSRLALQHAVETGNDYDIDYRVNRPDGTECWVAAKGRCIFDLPGKVKGMVGVVQDVTERKLQVVALERLSQEIKAQAQLFDATLSNITDLAYYFDLKGRWIYANKPLLDIWGRSLEEITGKSCLELGYPPELASRLEAQIQEVIETKKPVQGETSFTSAAGKVDEHEYIFSPVINARGIVTAVVGTTRLITARKQAENELKRIRDEAVAASRAKDDFLAALSHELRTPLNPVLLLASAAANNPELTPAVREEFELIRKNIDLEARLIDDLLDLTSITRGKIRLDLRRCDLHAIVKDALANVRAESLEKRQVLISEFGAEESIAWGDAVRLQQILWNIFKNAVKFTPVDGRILVETSSDHDQITIKITDSGIGMSRDEISRAFQAFSQGEHAAARTGVHRFGGLGLGLAISKMLVELHGGTIRAVSAGRDHGSTFIVEFPLWRSTVGEFATLPKAADVGARPHSLHPLAAGDSRSPIPTAILRRRILLVEDHAPTRLTLQHLLRARQFDVTPTSSATEAHRVALKHEFDLLISDVGLPDRNGYDLMAELRLIKPSLPGIALSGYGMEEDVARSQAAGFSIHLVKPITIGVLEAAIARLVPSLHGPAISDPNHP